MDKGWEKYLESLERRLEVLDTKLDKLDTKIDPLIKYKYKMIGRSTVISSLIAILTSIVVEIGLAFTGGKMGK